MKRQTLRFYRGFAITMILICSILLILSNSRMTFIFGIMGVTLSLVNIIISHIASIHDE